QVEVGESFYLAIDAKENHPLNSGLAAIGIDLDWDPRLFDSLDTEKPLSELVTANLPLFNRGSIDNANGKMDDLSGLTSITFAAGRPIGDGVFERFATLQFKAVNQADTASFVLTRGFSNIVLTPVGVPGRDDIQIYNEPVRIVSANDTSPVSV